jgi:hypothetical protein
VLQVDEIYTSSYSGVATYTKSPSTFPWWSARTNATTVVHSDMMFILGGKVPRTKTGGVGCFNDVWVYADAQVGEPGEVRKKKGRGTGTGTGTGTGNIKCVYVFE